MFSVLSALETVLFECLNVVRKPFPAFYDAITVSELFPLPFLTLRKSYYKLLCPSFIAVTTLLEI